MLAAASPSEQGMLAEHPQLGCLAGCLSRNRRSRVYRGETKRVVIVGGGFAAVHMCEELAKQPHDIKITMICPNDHLDIAWASPRAIARPETASRNVIPFHKIFERSKHAASMVTHVHDTVAWVTETYVETAMSCEVRSVHDPPRRVASDRPASLEPARLPFPALVRPSTFRCVPSDARVPVPVRPLPLPDAADPRTHPTPPHAQKYEYDVLVIGTGATYAEGSEAKRLKSNHTSMSGKDRVKELRELAERVKGAKGVMVVGAGPTGIELAAELGAAYPRVPVKLVTNKYEIGAGMPKPVKAALQQAFVSRPNGCDRGRARVRPRRQAARVRRGVHVRGDGAQHQLPRRRVPQGFAGRERFRQDGTYRPGARFSQRLRSRGLRQVVRRGWTARDGDDERAVPARARHREVRATGVRVERAAVHRG